jgi:DHA3 family macrolide efflux protein-like MFS transporter
MGMRAFVIIWAGQLISLLGTAMSQFGLTIWVYEQTGQATALALIGFFFVTPIVVLSPVIGAIVDRSNRKLMMMVSDLAAGLATIIQLTLFATGHLQVWHLYVTAAFAGTFQAFQWPAFSAAISMMLPKEHYGRANGMLQLADSASGIFAPMLAGVLLSVIGLAGLFAIDIVSFCFAVGALLFVHIPQPEATRAGREGKGNLLTESAYGFRYIFARPSLLGLQLVFFTGNFFSALGWTLLAPMILARTGNNELVFGGVQSAGAVGRPRWGSDRACPSGPRPAFCSAFSVPLSMARIRPSGSRRCPPTSRGGSFLCVCSLPGSSHPFRGWWPAPWLTRSLSRPCTQGGAWPPSLVAWWAPVQGPGCP